MSKNLNKKDDQTQLSPASELVTKHSFAASTQPGSTWYYLLIVYKIKNVTRCRDSRSAKSI